MLQSHADHHASTVENACRDASDHAKRGRLLQEALTPRTAASSHCRGGIPHCLGEQSPQPYSRLAHVPACGWLRCDRLCQDLHTADVR
jgi:hypothetical protein